MNRLLEDVHKQTISDEDFHRIGKLIEANSGIKMPLHKKIMLQSRLRKRMVQLQIPTFRQYVDFVLQEDNKNTELIQLLNVISTNKTDFFREPVHYKMLQKRALPDLLKKKDRIKIWSAGCSSGEEVYSLAMIMEECRQKYDRLNYEIIGTDISEPMLKKAASAVYKEEDVIDIPVEMRRKYLLRNKNKSSKLVRISGNLRKKVKISYLNFMNQDYELSRDFDVIFFRNVLIYYSKPTQIQVLQNVCNHLNEGGFLFIGLSENLFGFSLPLERLGSNVYQKKTKSS